MYSAIKTIEPINVDGYCFPSGIIFLTEKQNILDRENLNKTISIYRCIYSGIIIESDKCGRMSYEQIESHQFASAIEHMCNYYNHINKDLQDRLNSSLMDKMMLNTVLSDFEILKNTLSKGDNIVIPKSTAIALASRDIISNEYCLAKTYLELIINQPKKI